MNRFYELEDFLKYFASVYEQNPSLQITADTIYHTMMTYGMSKEDCNNPDIKNYFDYWIKEFESKKNLVVYHDNRQPRFLQFHNSKNKRDAKYTKLYLNYSKKNIYNSVNRVFSYLESKNILNYSKVADRIRADDVVLRIGDTKDAYDVISYINNDYQLSGTAGVTNPFVYRYGVVGIAFDDLLSYNTVVSQIAARYFNEKRARRSFEQVSLVDFRDYVSNLYKHNFHTSIGIQNFSRTNEFISCQNRHKNKEQLILNFEQIYKLLILAIDEKTELKDIMNHIDLCSNEKYNIEMCDYYKGILSNVTQKKTDEMVEIKKIIDDYISHIINTQGFGVVKIIFEEYMRGNYNYITKTNNFRNLFMENIRPEDIYQVTGSDIDLYEKHIYERRNVKEVQPEEPKQRQSVERINSQEINRKDLFDQFIQYNLKKYGEQVTNYQLNNYMNGDKNSITRDCNFRQLFTDNITADDIVKITNNNISNYVSIYSQYYISKPTYESVKYILDEYITYMLHLGASDIQVTNCLQFYISGNIAAITSDKNWRQLFQSYISPEVLNTLTSNDISGYVDYINQTRFGVSQKDEKVY